jgi:hypothetical protein
MPCRAVRVSWVVSLIASASAAHAAEPGTPAESVSIVAPLAPSPIDRRWAFKLNYGAGVFSPADANHYADTREHYVHPNQLFVDGFSPGYWLLLSLDVSAAYFPESWFGIRPNLVYLFSPRKISAENGGGNEDAWMHSLAPALSLDFVLETRALARYFVSPGVAYQFAWYEGYAARGLGVELALGTELSFGVRRNKGISIALVMRRADLRVHSRAEVTPASPNIDRLDFSSVMVRGGFQYGL